MKTFTDSEAVEWCKQWPLSFNFDNNGLLRVTDWSQSYRVDISKIVWRDLVSTARALAHLGSHTAETFSGGLVWIRRTGIAVPEMENVILRALERFRLGYGESRSLESARAQLFRSDEASECSATLLLVLLAEWDAYFVHPSGDWIAFIDNDNQIIVTARSVEIANDLRASLETWGQIREEPAPPRFF